MRTDKQAIQIYQQHLMHIGHINIVFKLGMMKIYLNIFNKHGKPIQSIMLFEADSARMGDVIDILRKHKLMLMPIRTGHTTMANAKAYVRHLHGLRRARSPRRS